MALDFLNQSYGIDAVLKVEPTFHEADSPSGVLAGVTAEILQDKSLGEQIRGDLLSIQTTNAVDAPCGSFRFTLPPRRVFGEKTWADILQPYTLVAIAFHRKGADSTCTLNPVPVMLGLVDDAQLTEDYSQEQPHRVVSVSGRTLSSVLNDQRWWFHHFLAATGAIEGELPPDIRDFYAVRPDRAALRDEIDLRTLGFFAIDLDLFKDVTVRHPVEGMRVAFEFFVGPPVSNAEGFIKLRFADGRALNERLLFDAQAALAAFFDPAARLIQQFVPTQMPEASCWQAMSHFAEPPFTEFFTDTFGSSVDDAVVQLIARKPPWSGHIAYPKDVASVAFSPGTVPGEGQSLFDSQYGAWNRDAQTVYVSGSDILSRNLSRGIGGQAAAFNFFEVLPGTSAAAGNSAGDVLYQQQIPPTIDEDPSSPSFIRRFGVRPMKLRSKYIAVLEGDNEKPLTGVDIRRHSIAYQVLLREWYYQNPTFWHGQVSLKGMPHLRVGMRLVDTDLNREFYVTRIHHSMTFEPTSPEFTTTAYVGRGRDLGGA